MRVVYQCVVLWGIDRVAERVSSWGGFLHHRQFFYRLALYYTIEKWFFIKSFQIFLYMAELRRFHIYVCACVWPCVVFLCILGILRAATCACMCAYILKLSNQSDFAWGWVLELPVPGFGFYIFIYLMINKYITSRALVNWARKILEKNLKKSWN